MSCCKFWSVTLNEIKCTYVVLHGCVAILGNIIMNGLYEFCII